MQIKEYVYAHMNFICIQSRYFLLILLRFVTCQLFIFLHIKTKFC